MRKVLVIGKAGQLAQALARASDKKSYQMQFLDRKQCDLSQESAHIKKVLFAQEKPDLIIIAAAYTQVDDAQSEQALAYAVNANAPEAIAQFCTQHNIALIHISTDYVFDGKSSTPYQHNDTAKPINVYGASKLSGERALMQACKHAVILRTSWVYDGFGKNFMTTMLLLTGKPDKIRVVSDQFGRPTYTAHLAHAILAMTESLLENPKAYKGIFHITGTGESISWADFATAIFSEANEYVRGPIHIKAISTKEYKALAKRPQYSVLDTSRFEKALGLTLPHWNEGLKEAIQEYKSTLRKIDMKRKGIILAGGNGTRLHPSTISISKQLMPVYDKPMIYYPLSVLMQSDIREILIITTPHDQSAFIKLLGDGKKWGLNIKYATQPEPKGLAQALIIAEAFLAGAPSALILGDNLFFGRSFNENISKIGTNNTGATIFAYYVKEPKRYGVIGFSNDNKVISLEEKPSNPASNYAVTGLYFYDSHASQYAKTIKPSQRGELEITDLNQIYLNKKRLNVKVLGEDTTWLDTGTHRSLLQAAQFVSVIEERQGKRICCPEEIAYQRGWINQRELKALGQALKKSEYGAYLIERAEQGRLPIA